MADQKTAESRQPRSYKVTDKTTELTEVVPANVIILLGYLHQREVDKDLAGHEYSIKYGEATEVLFEGPAATIMPELQQKLLLPDDIVSNISYLLSSLFERSGLVAAAVTLAMKNEKGQTQVGSMTSVSDVMPTIDIGDMALLLKGMVSHGKNFKEQVENMQETLKKSKEENKAKKAGFKLV